jgi:ribosomal protein S18 acetylase RimI-like enzyme
VALAGRLVLRPLTDEEYAEFARHSLEGYVAQKSELGGVPAEQARAEGERDFAELLPDGLRTPGHWIRVGEVDGVPVGRLWVGLRDDPGPRLAWVYDVEVDEPYQGRGHGRALMLAAEDLAREVGAERLGLNVFGGNARARRLYESLGYSTTALQMAKPLGGPAASSGVDAG